MINLRGKLSLQSVLQFGKYKGETVEDIIADNPKYLAWAMDNVNGFELNAEAQRELDAAVVDVDAFDGGGFDPRDDYYK